MVGVWVTYPAFHLTSALKLAFVVGAASKLDHGSSGSRINRVEKLGQRETQWIDAPGLHSARAIYRQ